MRAAWIALLLLGCKTDPVPAPDLSQPATCVVFLPSGIDRPACTVLGGDLLGAGDGHVLVTLESDAFLTFDKPMEFRMRGAVQPVRLSLAQLQPATLGELAVKGDQRYRVSPSYQGASWGSAQLTISAIEQLPAMQGDTTVTLVEGDLEAELAGVDNHKLLVPLRVTF